MLHLDTGNTAFMLLCSSLVMLMTPGLAFFYGGLVGRKAGPRERIVQTLAFEIDGHEGHPVERSRRDRRQPVALSPDHGWLVDLEDPN